MVALLLRPLALDSRQHDVYVQALADDVLLRLLLLLHVLEVLLLHGGRGRPAALPVEQLVGARDGVAAVVADDGRVLCERNQECL